MSSPDGTDLLRQLVQDARADRPDVDWDRLERSLLRSVDEDSAKAPERPPMHSAVWLWVAPTAALLAAAGIFWMSRPTSRPQHTVPAAPQAQAAHEILDGSKLMVPAAVEAFTEPVTVEHAGRATWTLAPRTLAHLDKANEIIEIALDRGTLDAHVVKSPKPESFVVIADHTRIAVHGTAFRVVRSDHDVTVDVSEGVVSVGPLGAPAVQRLGAASHGVFSLEGRPVGAGAESHGVSSPEGTPAVAGAGAMGEAAPKPGTESPAQARTERVAEPAPVPGASTHAATSSRSAQTGASTASAAAQAVGAVRSCFASQTAPAGDLKITAVTTLSLRVLPDGKVMQALLEPPLAPPVQSCIDGALGQIRFPASASGLSIEKTISLER